MNKVLIELIICGCGKHGCLYWDGSHPAHFEFYFPYHLCSQEEALSQIRKAHERQGCTEEEVRSVTEAIERSPLPALVSQIEKNVIDFVLVLNGGGLMDVGELHKSYRI